jgi:hypothetical protein
MGRRLAETSVYYSSFAYLPVLDRQCLEVYFKGGSGTLSARLLSVPVPHTNISRPRQVSEIVAHYCSTHFIEFPLSGMVRPSTCVFCFLDAMDVTFNTSLFLFFSEPALARSKHRLTGALMGAVFKLVVSTSNWVLMSESEMVEPAGVGGISSGGAIQGCWYLGRLEWSLS